MHGNFVRSRTQACIKTWWLQLSIYCKGLFQDHLGRVDQALVVGAFLSCQQEVCLCIFEYVYGEVDARELIKCLCVYTHACAFGGGVHFRMCMYICRCLLCVSGRAGEAFPYECVFVYAYMHVQMCVDVCAVM